MVVLAVTWMAKVGRESEVAAIFEKLSSRIPQGTRLPHVSGAQAQNRSAPLFRLRTVQRRRGPRSASQRAPFFAVRQKDLPKLGDRTEGHLFEPIG